MYQREADSKLERRRAAKHNARNFLTFFFFGLTRRLIVLVLTLLPAKDYVEAFIAYSISIRPCSQIVPSSDMYRHTIQKRRHRAFVPKRYWHHEGTKLGFSGDGAWSSTSSQWRRYHLNIHHHPQGIRWLSYNEENSRRRRKSGVSPLLLLSSAASNPNIDEDFEGSSSSSSSSSSANGSDDCDLEEVIHDAVFDDSFLKLALVRRETLNWCQHFVVPLGLCPWAAASLETSNAIQISVCTMDEMLDHHHHHHDHSVKEETQQGMSGIDDGSGVDQENDVRRTPILEAATEAVRDATQAFVNRVLLHLGEESSTILDRLHERSDVTVTDEEEMNGIMLPLDPNVGITFVVFADDWPFTDFYNWYLDLEEDFLNAISPSPESYVTLAPFHPDWQFGGDGADDDVYDADVDDLQNNLDYEKKSPYPIVSIVWKDVIERAGESATQAIAEHNEDMLMNQMDPIHLAQLWERSVKGADLDESKPPHTASP